MGYRVPYLSGSLHLIVLSFVVLFGCGGGTSGTGLGEDGSAATFAQSSVERISGLVRDSHGEPLGWVEVTDLVSGDSTITNSSGEFFFDELALNTQHTLEFEYQGLHSQVRIPSEAVQGVELKLGVEIDLTVMSVTVTISEGEAESVVLEESLCSSGEVACLVDK